VVGGDPDVWISSPSMFLSLLGNGNSAGESSSPSDTKFSAAKDVDRENSAFCHHVYLILLLLIVPPVGNQQR
jgi:hypothetical protein